MPAHRPLAERFHEKYMPEPMSGCWLWTGGTNERGYGIIGVTAYKGDKAHRVSWRIHRGDIPEGVNVLHRCDVPACVNPEHLFLGTLRDNMRDCVAKGRNFLPDNRGERSVSAILDWEKVSDIRTRRVTQIQYAELYGVSRSTVNQVQRNAIWKKEPACV